MTPAGPTAHDGRGDAIRPVDALLGFYLLIGSVALLFPGRPQAWPLWLGVHVAAAAVLLAPGPVRRWRSRLAEPLGRLGRVLADWYPLLLVPAFYFDLSMLNVAVHEGRYFDEIVQAWDAASFGGQPSRDLATRWPSLVVSETLHASYLSYYAVIYVPAVVLYARGLRTAFGELILAIMATFVLHYLFFIFFPVQGPRYLFPPPSGIEEGPVFRATHWLLGTASSRGTAFPSSHVGVAMAISLTLLRFVPRIGVPTLVLSVLLTVATVYGGFHYATDAWVGAIFGLAVAASLAAARPAAAIRHSPGHT